jgi:hypothetical protein
LRGTISGLQVGNVSGTADGNDAWGNTDAPFLVHFGNGDFESKFLTVLNDIGQWRAGAGRVESVDLRFKGEAVVNPDRTYVAQQRDLPAPNSALISNPVTQPVNAKPAHSTAKGAAKKHSGAKSKR